MKPSGTAVPTGPAGPTDPPTRRLAKRCRSLRAWLALLALLGGCFGDPSMQLPALPDGNIDAKLRQALEELNAAALAEPTSAERRGQLAMAYDVNDFHQRAIDAYGQAAKLAPEEFDWPYYRALLTARINADYEGALESLEDALRLDDSYVPAWLWRGEWLRRLGRTDEARAAYRRGAELGAGAPAQTGLAQLLFDAGRFQDAVAILEPLNAEGSDARIERMLGRAYRAIGRHEDARIASAKGQAAPVMQWLDPKLNRRLPYIAGFSNRLKHAQSLIQAGQQKNALPIARALVADRPDDIAAINTLVWALAASGRHEAAKAALRDGLKKHPEEPRLHLMLATAYQRQGGIERARRHLERVLELAPDNTTALEQLGWLLARQGKTDQGIALLEQALEKGAREPKQLLYRLGLLEGTAKRWPQAAARFQDAAQLDAAFTMAHIHLGRCLAEAGRIDEARKALDWADRIGTHAEQRASARRRLVALERSSR